MKKLFLLSSMFLAVSAFASSYDVSDLQALEKQQGWSELLAHLNDIPPHKRDNSYNKIVINACLREYDDDSFWEQARVVQCAEKLKSAAVADPKNLELPWRIAKWSVGLKNFSDAAPYFALAISSSSSEKCKDKDVNASLGAALARSPDSSYAKELIRAGQTLAFERCWPSSRLELDRRFVVSGFGSFLVHVCSRLKLKNTLTEAQEKICTKHNAFIRSEKD